MALGALIIKERFGKSDEETVEQIRENPYLQYLLGYKAHRDEKPFDPSLFVYFHKRFGKKTPARINGTIGCKALSEEKKASKAKSLDDEDGASGAGSASNRGKLLVNVTCTLADITFPTNLKLLNTAREKSEEVIDILHKLLKGRRKKHRTYCKIACKAFLSAAKSKRLSKNKMRKALRKQLGYLKRNLKTIEKLSHRTPLSVFSRRQYKNLLVM